MLPSQIELDRKGRRNPIHGSSREQPAASGPFSCLNKPYIHDLPDDILLEIFSGCISMENDSGWNIPIQYILTTVCHRWRNLVLYAPLLWTSIRIPNISSFDTFKYFERSRPALIDVQFNCVSSWTRMESGLATQLSSAIAKHASRLRSLKVRVWETQEVYPIFQEWKNHDTINLESLDISSISPYDNSPTTPFSFSSPTFTDFSSWKGGKYLRSLKLDGLDFQGFSPLPSLTTLEIPSLNTSTKEFRALLNSSPLLTTLVIRLFEMSPHCADNSGIRPQIDASSLRSLAVNITNNHASDCGCFLPCISMKELEYLEVVYLWSTFTSHHASIVSQWKNLPSLRKLRIHSVSIWMNDVSFLCSLPATTNLEIIDFPKSAEPALTYILNLNNLKSITFDLSSPRVPERSLDAETLSDVVRRGRPKLGCPTILRLPSSMEVEGTWLELQATLSASFTILSSPTEDGFLDDYLNNQIFEDEDEPMINGLWGSDFDVEFGEEEFEEYDEFDYDRDEIEYLGEDDTFDDYDEDNEFVYEIQDDENRWSE